MIDIIASRQSSSHVAPPRTACDLPIIAVDMPVVYEDEGQEQLGDSLCHSMSQYFIYFGLVAHLADRPELEPLPDMDLHYHPTDREAYISPDLMIVCPATPLPLSLASYRIGDQGPAPILVVEVLSERSHQQGDLTTKPIIYAALGVAEYILVDVTGDLLPEKLQIRCLDQDEFWIKKQDSDGGVTSALGFRIIIDEDGEVRVINQASGNRYARPHEAEQKAEALRNAERARLEALEGWREAEVARREGEETRRELEHALRESQARTSELEAYLARLKSAGSDHPKPNA